MVASVNLDGRVRQEFDLVRVVMSSWLFAFPDISRSDTFEYSSEYN